jgi:hypothetical protein
MKPPTGRHQIVTIIALCAVMLPVAAEGSRCIQPLLPKLDEPAEVIRARLEAEGRWHRNLVDGRTPPADPQVGDTWLWYIWDLSGFPEATLKPCTVRARGENLYVVVDDDEWNVSIDQADVDRIVAHFDHMSVGAFPDQGIWDLNTSHFGDPPNPLDGLERIFLLYYRFDIAADGYFWSFDQFPDGTQSFASNEADVVYLATDSGDPSSNYMLAVAAHEFEHLIHFNQDSNESAWVDEGLGELAMWLFGNPDVISSFNANPDNSLTDWGSAWADYIQTYLWTLYAYEQYGGQPMIWDLVHLPSNGMAGYLTALTGQGFNVTMEDVFGDWAVANYLDDTAVAGGQYGYQGDTLPPFSAFRSHDGYPAAGSGSVQNWATDYVRLTDFADGPTIVFDGADSGAFRMAVLAIDPMLPTLVHWVMLDADNDGSVDFADAAGYAEIVVSIANVNPTGSSAYSYTVEVPVDPDVFDDGFESGDTNGWSLTIP